MQIRLLGRVEASVDGCPVALGGPKQRAILAMLALRANRTVTADALIAGLWDGNAPASAAKMVQNYVWRLRRGVADDGGAAIFTHGRGYELQIDPELVDVCRFERLVAEAGRAAEAGLPAAAAREALALFRGDPLADVADEPFAAEEIRRLEELRLTAAELAVDAELAAGRHQQIIGEIDGLLAENPLRERLHGLRMLALYRCGRQAEALDAYREARRTLVEEIGIEPGPELRRLHEAILRQDPSLDVESFIAELPRELDDASAPPLIGRDGELRRLRVRWQRAAAGAGALVTLVGGYGIGKTRLAAALAGDAHREDAAVLYATGTAAPEAALAAIAQVRDARRPVLLVLDDADRAPAEVHAAVRELALALANVPALVIATGQEAAALARLKPRDSVTLGPLDAEAVRLIAGLYAPAGGVDAVPVETLLATSRGVARRVHEAAGEWARREATRRVDATASRMAAGRGHTRALEAELTGNVIELRSAHERTRLLAVDGEDARAPVVCPYKGLATFDVDDAEYFFGREQLVAELVARLVGEPLLAVVGPSGSGKSSMVRAGLLPALAGGVLPGSDTWARALIRPGAHPLRELRAAADARLLVVDQFEELFTACCDERERSDFVAALADAATAGASAVVLAVRADFYGRCAAYPELARLLGANNVLVGPMSREELRRAIERPAQRAGLSVESELVDALLGDIEGQPGALPLLSTALLALWRARDGRRLRLAAYTAGGGVQGAVARMAEDAYLGLDPSRQAVARSILLRLAGESDNGAVVRRRIPLSELDAESRPDVAAVLGRLADRRLLTVGEGTVEVAHEALLREWPRLRTWLDEDVEGQRVHQQITAAAASWDADARDPGALYRGARLSAALEWRATHEGELNATEAAFLDAGRAAGERAQRRLRLGFAGVSLLLLAAVVAGVVAIDQRGNARTEARIAESQRLGAQALTEPALDRSLLIARQAVALDDSAATHNTLLSALLRSPAALGVMRGSGGRMLTAITSPDGRLLAAGDNRGRLTAFDTATRTRVAVPFRAAKPIQVARFSPDGSRLVVVSGNVDGGALDVLDGRSYERIARHRLGHLGEQVLADVAFSRDSRRFVLAYERYRAFARSPLGILQRWDAASGQPLGSPRRVPGAGGMVVAFDADDRLLTVSDAARETVIRDSDSLQPLRHIPNGGPASSVAVSADGRLVALGRQHGSVRVLALATGGSRPAPGRHAAPVRSAVFTPDGRALVTGADDGTVLLHRLGGGGTERFEGHAARVAGVAVSPDGSTAYSASLDGTVIAWDLDGARRLGRRFGAASGRAWPVPSEQLAGGGEGVGHNIGSAPGGDTLAIPRERGVVRLIDTATLRPTGSVRVSRATDASAWGIDIAPDGRTMATASSDGFLQFWDARTRAPLGRRLAIHPGWPTWSPSFSGDGRLVAVVGGGFIVRVWDVRRQTELHQRSYDEENLLPRDVAMRPDGKRLVVPVENGPGSGRVDVLAVPSLEVVKRIPARFGRWSRFSADGKLLVLGNHEGAVQIYDGRTFAPRGRPLLGHSGVILSADFSPDGRMLATSSADGTVRLWNTATGDPIGVPLPGIPNLQVGVAFTRGGTHVAAVYDGGLGYLWDVRPAAWARRACAVAGRPLTRTEWSEALPRRSYAPACTQSRR